MKLALPWLGHGNEAETGGGSGNTNQGGESDGDWNGFGDEAGEFEHGKFLLDIRPQ
jgi:hypothetical protein